MASDFATLRKRGYGTIYAIKIEGIPFVFTEGPVPYRVDSEAVPSAPSGHTASAAFAVVADTTIDQEIDRESSVARGKSLEILLSWDVLEDEGILADLFRRPAYFTTLDADVAGDDVAITVADTTGFGAVSHAGQFYLGRELVKYTGTTSTEFTGCTRGYLGLAYAFRKDDPGSHGIVTPTPLAWKGRFVTIYEHLVSPEGRILDSTWTEGTYNRELWKGYLSAPPRPGQLGMVLSALPLVRLAAQELGSSLQGKTIGGRSSKDWWSIPVYLTEGATVTFGVKMESATDFAVTLPDVVTSASFPQLEEGIVTIGHYAMAIADGLKTAFSSFADVKDVICKPADMVSGTDDEEVARLSWSIKMIPFDSGTSSGWPSEIQVVPAGAAYWITMDPALDGMHRNFKVETPGADVYVFTVSCKLGLRDSPWLIVKDIEGNAGVDFAIPSSGLGVVEAGDQSEVMRWSQKISTDSFGVDLSPYAVLEVVERMVGADYSTVAQLPANLDEDGTLDVVAGQIGTLDGVAETMLQSSGTGERGSKDTLGLGFGLGVPEVWIDIDATGSAPITAESVPLLAVGRSSFASIFAGWYQLAGWCLVVRRSLAGVLQFQRVDVSPAQVITTGGAGFLGVALAKADVVVGGTDVPRLVIAPNQVMIDTTAGPYDSAEYTFNAVGRIQSEGAHSTSLAVPGGRVELIGAAVLSIMARGDGQSIVKFAVAPWIDAEVGDPISVTVAHPMLYNWADGTRPPANIPGRCVGTSMSLKTGEQSLTILLDGILAPAFYLCPVTTVSNVSGNDVTVGDGGWFQSGETVRFYNRGKESSESGDLAVTTVSGNVLTLTSSPPSWLTSANATRATHPAYAAASTDQQGAFMYARSDRFWRV